ncbi:MAG: hypothetical protein COB93_06895 [Sneathiella sp.]|nr:MAG: hypothetical protein COB93_06895 [Sneathiella sp.]
MTLTGRLTPELRDLEWVISSPFLLADMPSPDLATHPETVRLLSELRKDPTPLLKHLQNIKRHTLGSYFEQLVIFWLSNLPSVTVVAANLQVQHGTQTIGEFDLLFEFDGRAYHWELSVKFYLNTGTGRNEADFVGPLKKDNLGKKLDRLYGHQLTLPGRPDAIKLLSNLGMADVTSFPWVKGALFQPFATRQSVSLPPRISTACSLGVWTSLDALPTLSLPAFNHFILLQKRRWLTSEHYADEAYQGGRSAFNTEVSEFLRRHNSPVLGCLLSNQDGEPLPEIYRLFIVPNDWQRLSV